MSSHNERKIFNADLSALRGESELKMSAVTVWNFENNSVRTVEINGEGYFVGKDVSDVLGYENSRKAITDHVDEEDRIVLNDKKIQEMALESKSNETGTFEFMSPRGLTFINESGVFSLIMSSKLPTAKKFKRWVTSEVLPSIRKHGLYATEELINNPDIMLAAFQALKAEREKNSVLESKVAVQNQQIAELQPKASYYDVVLNCKDLVSMTTIAKDYGWSAKTMNTYLHAKGVQFKQGAIWLLYQKYASCGYTSTKTHTYPGNDGEVHSKVHTYWTQSGRLFIYGLLRADGILPLIESRAA